VGCLLVCLQDALQVKEVEFPNRIVFPPIQTRLATGDGAVTDDLLEHYVRRSQGLGLLILEHGYVSRQGRMGRKELGIHDDALIEGLTQFTRRIHALKTPLVIQVNHGGALSKKEVTGKQPLAPSPMREAKELTYDEAELIIDDFRRSTERAVKSGFDGVELHGAHGFLLNQFFSPLTNRRRDKYGGSLQNRMRFPLEVVERVKEQVGGKLLLYRIGSDDLHPTGTQIEDAMVFARRLVEAGVDVIDVSGGICGSRPSTLQGIQGFFIPQAQKIKAVVNVPIIGVGGIVDPQYANQLIKEEQVDLVAVGRVLLKDPEWAQKALATLS
jgi:2,4-dienoyl-CoA reductase-like NADH-dependent reductase (Old Yellow Enzyme family)